MKKILPFLIFAFAFYFFNIDSYADSVKYEKHFRATSNYDSDSWYDFTFTYYADLNYSNGVVVCNDVWGGGSYPCSFFAYGLSGSGSSFTCSYTVHNSSSLGFNSYSGGFNYSVNNISYTLNGIYAYGFNPNNYTFSGDIINRVSFSSCSLAMVDVLETPVSNYDSSITMGALYKISLYSSNTNDVICWGDGNAESIQIKVYVNDVEKYQHMYNTSLIPTVYHFKHLDNGVSDGDVIKVVATPFTNNDYGASKEITWVARSSLVPSSLINISNSNLLSPSVTVNNISIPVGIENVDVKSTTPNGSVVTTYYSNSYDVSNVSSSDINTVTNNIVNNYYNSSDTVNNIVNNNSYSYSYNFGGGTLEEMTQTYNNGIGSIKGYSDDLISSISIFNGTPFQPLFITVSVGLGLIVALALIFVAIKVVGLIL